MVRSEPSEFPADLIHESIKLNKGLVKLPFQTQNLDIEIAYNLWQFYQGVLTDQRIPLQRVRSVYHVDRISVSWSSWDAWFQQVVWYGNKRGAYLYGNNAVLPQLAGHF
jgi:hypothetical protein